ncbi:MAG: MBL fold metallo-hydrolase, partial [Muribaculaceae bacterium]|nr:MBL fold metallo-hydrolase [Muribaculaceae bacterium]
MARYKKRPGYDESVPGLFDDLEESVLFPGVDSIPTHPLIERAAKREGATRDATPNGLRNNDIFDGEDFSPLELSPTVDRLNFISFGSGSSGNSAYVGDGEQGILIDAGVDDTTVISELRRHGIKIESIKGILLTHDHSDHVRYVYKLIRKRTHMAVYCTPRTLNGMLRRHNISNRIKDYHHPIYKEHPFVVGNFTVTPFEVMHDGSDNVGFLINRGSHNLVVATDLGCISERADYYMRKANYLMIEANYDEAMLAAGTYPEYLKSRIRSNTGHLANTVTAEYLRNIYTPILRNVMLCHLSKDNNTPDIALHTVERALTAAGITVGDGSNTPYARMAPLQL